MGIGRKLLAGRGSVSRRMVDPSTAMHQRYEGLSRIEVAWMGRKVQRVPIDFDWPLSEPWKGYLMPDQFNEKPCTGCKGNGFSPHAQHLHDLWYGHIPFSPESTRSTPLRHDTPAVRAFAERNVAQAPDYYGTGEDAIIREGHRLAGLWNGRWSHHLTQDDVNALVAAGRLMNFTHTWNPETRWQKIDPPVVPTAEQVNEWSLRGLGHDSINAMAVIRARCEREGVPFTCETCQGHGSLEVYEGQRAEAEAWEPTEPPAGDGWQLWETVSEGSPVSPVFPTAEALAQWLTTTEGGRAAGPSQRPMTIEQARGFVKAGWAPSMIGNAGGIHGGAEYVGTEEALRGHLKGRCDEDG